MSLYTENEEKWLHLIEIDYFTHFIKAWIAFNAWYKNNFLSVNSDREAINKIKSEKNRIKSKFNSLLTGNNEESEIFKNYLGQLHYLLLNNEINNDEQRIWFESFIVELDRNCLEQRNEENSIKIGSYKFINNQELLFKGLIEILYSLRNVLFHGQIIPDNNTNKVYEPAYKILKMLLK